ncbi:MAG: biotin--[acetyl-CoA-carboxylase] ligase [Gammaproteobacteria bacterium]|jgi:BirA family biotin operon repressor/biotin-[acetyl-CoA-carboxylase] ligase|nr:biotin--[acetyl-CoA-carboxylase] ligase [Gammaproteobacteria bacterium]
MDLLFEPLNAKEIMRSIENTNYSKLKKLEIFGTIDSTNQYLLEKIKEGESGWVCLAEQQTAARGRRGRAWFSPLGSNIACSLLWHFQKEVDISGLAIAVSVMVVHSLKKYGIYTGIQLKWPNDIVFAGRKLAGILLERCGNSVVIGIGLNIHLPKPSKAEWIDLTEIAGQSIARNYLTGLLINELLKSLTQYQKQGLRAFIQEWRQHDFLIGKGVTVSMPQKIVLGQAQGISDSGELLVLDEAKNLQRFCYGEVSVR